MDADRRAEGFEQVREFMMAHKRELLRASRRRTGFDPEDLLGKVASKILGRLGQMATDDEFEATLGRVLDISYWHRAVRNAGIDQHRKKEVDPRTLHTNEPADPVADEAVANLDAERRAAALGNAITALVDRHHRYPGPVNQFHHPQLTAAQWTVLQAVSALPPEKRWVRGMQTEVAKRLGLTRATVSSHLQTVDTILRLTRYVAGVLASPRTLRHRAAIDAALDGYEDWLAHPPVPVAGTLMRDLAKTVRALPDSGTRARIADLPGQAGLSPEAAEARARGVHDLEGGYAATIGNPLPNCAACCAAHNPTPDRQTEF